MQSDFRLHKLPDTLGLVTVLRQSAISKIILHFMQDSLLHQHCVITSNYLGFIIFSTKFLWIKFNVEWIHDFKISMKKEIQQKFVLVEPISTNSHILRKCGFIKIHENLRPYILMEQQYCTFGEICYIFWFS